MATGGATNSSRETHFLGARRRATPSALNIVSGASGVVVVKSPTAPAAVGTGLDPAHRARFLVLVGT